MVDADRIEYLWARACEDAGYRPDEIVLVMASTPPASPDEPRSAYWPPDWDDGANPIELTEDERAVVDHAGGRHRIGIPAGYTEEQTLALMRWTLEFARQRDFDHAVYDFGRAVSESLGGTYSELGRGGMIVDHLAPTFADANAAASRLVDALFGRQTGELFRIWGPLFRPAELRSHDTLPKRLTVYAAIHAEAFTEWARGDAMRDQLLRDLDENAPEWWHALVADAGFGHLRGSVPFFWPTADEIEEFEPNPVVAWAPFRDLIARAQRRGEDVLDGSVPGAFWVGPA